MKLVIPALLSLASLALGQSSLVCPTATRTIQNRGCGKTCPFSDCSLQTTIRKPCGCSTLPTATLIAPCEADCPYQGCDIEFHTSPLPCPITPTSSTRRWPRPTTTSSRRTTSSTPTATGVITIITMLPPRTTTTSTTKPLPTCPTVTRTTQPADCPVVRCPVPTCRTTSEMVVPCGCTPKTVLYVQGCATECPDCVTRTETVSVAC